MLVHLCLSVLLTVISLIVFICTVTYELINDHDDDDDGNDDDDDLNLLSISHSRFYKLAYIGKTTARSLEKVN